MGGVTYLDRPKVWPHLYRFDPDTVTWTRVFDIGGHYPCRVCRRRYERPTIVRMERVNPPLHPEMDDPYGYMLYRFLACNYGERWFNRRRGPCPSFRPDPAAMMSYAPYMGWDSLLPKGEWLKDYIYALWTFDRERMVWDRNTLDKCYGIAQEGWFIRPMNVPIRVITTGEWETEEKKEAME